jgi:hypothetical protein
MDRDSNMARWIRAATETLGEYAEDYGAAGMDAEHDEIEEVREALGRLHRLPDPEDADDDRADYFDRDVVQDQENDGPDEYEWAERGIRGG